MAAVHTIAANRRDQFDPTRNARSPGDDVLATVGTGLAARRTVVVGDPRRLLETLGEGHDDPTVEVARVRILADGDDATLARNGRVAVVSDSGQHLTSRWIEHDLAALSVVHVVSSVHRGHRAVNIADRRRKRCMFRNLLPDLDNGSRADLARNTLEDREPVSLRIPGVSVDDHVFPLGCADAVVEQLLYGDRWEKFKCIDDRVD